MDEQQPQYVENTKAAGDSVILKLGLVTVLQECSDRFEVLLRHS